MSTCRCRVNWTLIVVCAFLLVILANSASVCDSIAHEKRQINGFWAHVITANLNDPKIRIDIGLPAKGISHSEPFAKMVERTDPVAAVTGTYFDTRSLLPVGTVVVRGRAVHTNHIGTTVCFTEANQVTFVNTAKGESCTLSGVDCGLRTGPRLLAGGAYVLNMPREGFRDPGLFGRHKRVVMGVTKHNKLLLVAITTPATFGQAATIMKSLGAVDAVCLDGGTSSAMYYRGKVICSPGRSLTNIVEVHSSPTYVRKPGSVATGTVVVQSAPTPVIPANVYGIQAESGVAVHQLIAAAHTSGSAAVRQAMPEEAALFPHNTISGLSKGGRAFFPVDRTKLASLKSAQHTKHFVHVAADVKVMHHLVS